MHTSYAFITGYKQRIANLSVPQPPPRGARQAPPRDAPNAPVERRKLLSRFRQFLSEEEKFWISLVTWFRRTFDLHEAQPILVSLEMVSANPEDNPDPVPEGRTTRGYLLPRHSDTVIQCTPEQRQAKLSSVSKALIFLGDIARYKEQYNEAGGRPKAGVEAGPPARTSGKNKKTPIPRARDYEKARQRYEQARTLVPHEGNPSNQLAILSSYQMDTFNAIVHYYRAICVQQPYDGAAENMGKSLKKSLDFWNTKGKAKQQEATVPRLKIEVFKEQIIALHAHWGQYQGVETMDPESLQASDELCKSSISLFHDLIAGLLLHSEVISKIVILGLGALWKYRMLRSPGAKRRPRSNPRVEAQISGHLLAVLRSLLEVGLQELADDPAGDTDDIAQKISATLRRMLPALRMANKWLRTNYRFYANDEKKLPVEGVAEFWKVYTRFFTTLGQKFPIEQLTRLETPLDEDLDIRGFLPLTKLMVTDSPGESVDRAQVHPNEEQLMRIWDLLGDAKALAQTKVRSFPCCFRNSHLTLDKDTPIAYDDRVFSIKGQENSAPLAPVQIQPRRPVPPQIVETESDAMETDDDPVNDAIRAVIDADTDEEVVYPRSVRVLCFPKVSMINCVPSRNIRASPPPRLTSDLPQTIPQHMITPPHVIRQLTSPLNLGLPQLPSPNIQPLHISPPRFPPPVSPPRVQPTSRRGSEIFSHMVPTHVDVRARTLSVSQPKSAGTTAQDLLNGVLGLPSNTNDPAPAATTLYSGLGGLTSSVWSPPNDTRYPPVGGRHQRSFSQLNPSLAPGMKPGSGVGNGLGPIDGLSPFLPPSSLPQSSSQLSWQPSQPSQPHTDITPHPRLNPIGHHRTQSSGVPPYLTSPNSATSNLFNIRPTQPITGASVNFNPIDTSEGLGSGPSNYPLARQGLSPTSQALPFNLPFGNSLGIQGGGWER